MLILIRQIYLRFLIICWVSNDILPIMYSLIFLKINVYECSTAAVIKHLLLYLDISIALLKVVSRWANVKLCFEVVLYRMLMKIHLYKISFKRAYNGNAFYSELVVLYTLMLRWLTEKQLISVSAMACIFSDFTYLFFPKRFQRFF